jgi:hypothetical protein
MDGRKDYGCGIGVRIIASMAWTWAELDGVEKDRRGRIPFSSAAAYTLRFTPSSADAAALTSYSLPSWNYICR